MSTTVSLTSITSYSCKKNNALESCKHSKATHFKYEYISSTTRINNPDLNLFAVLDYMFSMCLTYKIVFGT